MDDMTAPAAPIHDDVVAAARALEHGPAQAYLEAAEAALADVGAGEGLAGGVAAVGEDVDLRAVGRRAEALVEVGNARRRMGDLPGALELLDEAVSLGALARSIDPDAGTWLGPAHHRTAIVYDALNDLPKAIDELRKAKVEFERADDDTGVARVLNSLGIANSRSGDLERALDLFGRSLDHAVATRDARREAAILSNVSITTRLLDRAPEAVSAARRALALSREVGDADSIASALTNLALALGAAGERAEAGAVFTEGLGVHEDHGDPFYLAEHLRSFGEFHLSAGALDAARPLLERSLELAEAGGAAGQMQAAHERMADLWRQRGVYARALEHFEAHHRATLDLERATAARELQAQKWQAEAELAHRDASLARREREVATARYARLASDHRELEMRSALLELRSRQDHLTGVANRRYFDERIADEIVHVRRTGGALTLVLVDVDQFKHINDRFGHAVGDEVLRRLAELLVDTVRDTDLVARLGGEEFGVLLPGSDADGGAVVAEKIRAAIAAATWPTVGAGLRVTASAGIASLSEVDGGASELLVLADERLYRAKRAGRNRIVATSSIAPEPAGA